MKSIVFSFVLVAGVSAFLVDEQLIKFQTFKLKHGKTYRDLAEETQRFDIFKNNLRAIKEHNALYEQGLKSYTKESLDWRTTGQITGVKNQGNCGSCWAFSVTGSTEAAYYRKSGNLVPLSEQQLIDCSTNLNDGCNGGYLDQSFPWVQQYGLESEDSYPYTGTDDKCKYPFSNIVTKIDGYKSIKSGDEDALLDAVANIGPISVAMDASYLDSYSEGIYYDIDCRTDRLNHAVLIVGYGYDKMAGSLFWIVKNSWGEDFGESGYFRILRADNECGIAQDAVYPVIN